ncbi:MOS1T transposase, partial [Pseudoatta argentina]
MFVEIYGDTGDTAPTDKCREWFRRFKDGDFSVEDKPRSGQPVYYELLKPGDRYRLQLIRLSRALREKRPEYEQRHDKVIFLHDNARPHVARIVKKYLETLKWDVLPHPPYSPDIAPSDYWLFRRMQHDLASHRFTSFAEIENWLQNWIASKDE